MKLIWNPWKKIEELKQDLDYLELSLEVAYGDIDVMRDALKQIAMVAGPRSSAVVRRMSNMAQDAVDKLYGFELGEE